MEEGGCALIQAVWELTRHIVADRPLLIDLNVPVHITDVPLIARKFMWWWLGELSDMMPGVVRQLFPKAPQVANLFVDGDVWRVTLAGSSSAPVVIDSSRNDKGVADQILNAAPNFSFAKLVIVLPSSQVLRRNVELSLMPERQMRGAIELQVDRLTPFRPETVRVAVRVKSRDAVDGKAVVDCAFAPRASVDELEQRLSRLGISAVAVDIADAEGVRQGFDLKASSGEAETATPWMVRAGLVTAVAFSWMASGWMWDSARERELAQWQSRIDSVRPQAMRSVALRQRLDGLIEPFEIARKHKAAAHLNFLKELTSVLPDTVRLTEIKVEKQSIEIAGLASDASQLIAKLEASPLFKDVKFRSQVMRRPESNKDRFEIALTVEEGRR